MKKLLPFIAALALVGQGCLAPAPSAPAPTPVPPTPEVSDSAAGEHDSGEHEMDMTGEPSTETVEGEATIEEGVAVFDVSGRNFAYSPNVIRVKQGQKVRIKFTSSQGFHDWVVDEFDARTIRINAGDDAVYVEFTPNKAGTFEFYCSVGQHRAMGMVGTLIVEAS